MRATHLSIAVSDERALREAIMCWREHEKGTGIENSTEQGKNLTRIRIGKGNAISLILDRLCQRPVIYTQYRHIRRYFNLEAALRHRMGKEREEWLLSIETGQQGHFL